MTSLQHIHVGHMLCSLTWHPFSFRLGYCVCVVHYHQFAMMYFHWICTQKGFAKPHVCRHGCVSRSSTSGYFERYLNIFELYCTRESSLCFPSIASFFIFISKVKSCSMLSRSSVRKSRTVFAEQCATVSRLCKRELAFAGIGPPLSYACAHPFWV